MTKILAFDTETTGLPDMQISPGDPAQPWPVQIAAIMADENGVHQHAINFLVNPGVPITPGALATHGITQPRVEKFGVKPLTAVTVLFALVARADVIVGHNLDFDINIINLAKLRLGIHHETDLFDGKEHFCTQKKTAHYIKLPPTERMVQAGFHNMPKSPTLAEAHQYFLGEAIPNAHDAMADTAAALRIYFQVKRMYAEA